jgi:asparagine synthase (glutamine-hydrolysing)
VCGIYGFVATSDLGSPEQVDATLAAMDRALVHRGPDDHGSYVDAHCAMGMRRLSIIDLGGGRQPISNEDGSIWVVFNGEIYNYRQLRDGLLTRGHRFTTTSDTEVLVHLYEERGEALVEQLSGMFGFAIWDGARRRLLLARDRLGIKPLYYAATPRGLVFASELKAVLCHGDVRRRISPAALSHYLSFGTTPSDQSIIDGVRKLPPGCLLSYGAGEAALRRYWSLPSVERVTSAADAEREVRQLVRDAVRSHLVSDVPVGAFLSGGVDSATVVGTMVELGARPKTFSIGFEETEFNELAYARQVARRFATDHHELVVRPDAWELTEQLVWYLDEPFADVSAVPTFLVSQLAAAHVKVVLSGDGGDELFGGYDRYLWSAREERRFGWMPPFLQRALAAAAELLPDAAPGKNYLRHLARDAAMRYVDGESLIPAHIKRHLLDAGLLMQLHQENCAIAQPIAERLARLHALERSGSDLVRRLMQLDFETYLPLDILTKVDRMTMAHSLEARPPLLDHTLVERIFPLPSELKIDRRGTQKAIFKRAVADLLPLEIVHRPKRGFGVPIRQWFRGPLRDPVEELLTEKRTRERGWLDAVAVRALLDEHQRGRRDQSLRLWSLLMLELWSRNFLDQAPPIAAAPRRQPTKERAHG